MLSLRTIRQGWLGRVMMLLILMFSVQATQVNAAMISTGDVIQTEHEQYTKDELLTALESEELQQQLMAMGVDPEVLEQRVASLTPGEISTLNNRLEQQPAGEGFVGLLALIFIVFIITDVACVTDVLSFVKCAR